MPIFTSKVTPVCQDQIIKEHQEEGGGGEGNRTTALNFCDVAPHSGATIRRTETSKDRCVQIY